METPQYELCEKHKNSFVGEDLVIRNQRNFSQNMMKHWLMPAPSIVKENRRVQKAFVCVLDSK